MGDCVHRRFIQLGDLVAILSSVTRGRNHPLVVVRDWKSPIRDTPEGAFLFRAR